MRTSESAEPTQPSTEAVEKLASLRQKVCDRQVALRVWNRYFTPAEKAELGGSLEDAWKQHRTAPAMWASVRNMSYCRAVIEVAEAVGFLLPSEPEWLLSQFGELSRDQEKAREQAIEKGHLVVSRETRTVHWRGAPLTVDWVKNGEAWTFFLTACDCCEAGENITREKVGSTDEDAVTKKKNRLKSAPGFPPEIVDQFEPAGEKGVQRFAFPAEQLHVFPKRIRG